MPAPTRSDATKNNNQHPKDTAATPAATRPSAATVTKPITTPTARANTHKNTQAPPNNEQLQKTPRPHQQRLDNRHLNKANNTDKKRASTHKTKTKRRKSNKPKRACNAEAGSERQTSTNKFGRHRARSNLQQAPRKPAILRAASGTANNNKDNNQASNASNSGKVPKRTVNN
jgi:hypothetical protein